MPVWGLCGGPSLQEQQWGAGACTLLLASPRACSSLTGRRFTVLWATYGFSRNPCHSSYGPHASPRLGTNTVVLSLCVPASQARTLGQAGLSPSGTKLSLTTERLSPRPVGCALLGSQEGGARQNARVYFYFQPPASIYPQGRPMNHRARRVGLAAACPLNPAPSVGPVLTPPPACPGDQAARGTPWYNRGLLGP